MALLFKNFLFSFLALSFVLGFSVLFARPDYLTNLFYSTPSKHHSSNTSAKILSGGSQHKHLFYAPRNSTRDYLLKCDSLNEKKLLVIAGLGGSGTRSLQHIFSKMFWFGGNNPHVINIAGDSKGCYRKETAETLLKTTKSANLLWSELKERVPHIEKLAVEVKQRLNSKDCLIDAKKSSGSCMWGFKNPQSFILWPIIAEFYPKAKFVHVIRDGRDMVFSENKIQLKIFGDSLLNTSSLNTRSLSSFNTRQVTTPQNGTLKLQQMAYWNKMNVETYQLGQKLGHEMYLLIRVEDLVTKNISLRTATLNKLFTFVLEGLPFNKTTIEDLSRQMLEVYDLPEEYNSYGRWIGRDPQLIKTIEEIGKEGLTLFGYL